MPLTRLPVEGIDRNRCASLFDQFITERQYLTNVSQNAIQR